jgi:hypothetical protein
MPTGTKDCVAWVANESDKIRSGYLTAHRRGSEALYSRGDRDRSRNYQRPF